MPKLGLSWEAYLTLKCKEAIEVLKEFNIEVEGILSAIVHMTAEYARQLEKRINVIIGGWKGCTCPGYWRPTPFCR